MSFSSCLFSTYGTEPVPHVFDKKMPTVAFIFQITDALKGIADRRIFFLVHGVAKMLLRSKTKQASKRPPVVRIYFNIFTYDN